MFAQSFKKRTILIIGWNIWYFPQKNVLYIFRKKYEANQSTKGEKLSCVFFAIESLPSPSNEHISSRKLLNCIIDPAAAFTPLFEIQSELKQQAKHKPQNSHCLLCFTGPPLHLWLIVFCLCSCMEAIMCSNTLHRAAGSAESKVAGALKLYFCQIHPSHYFALKMKSINIPIININNYRLTSLHIQYFQYGITII